MIEILQLIKKKNFFKTFPFQNENIGPVLLQFLIIHTENLWIMNYPFMKEQSSNDI